MVKAPSFRIIEDTKCTLCGRVLWIGDVVHENETRTEFMCSGCYDYVTAMAHVLEPNEPYLAQGEADALAARWVRGEVSPQDFDPRVQWWQSEEAVDEAIRLGYVHRLQRNQEIERRRGSGEFRKEAKAFVDEYPMKGYGVNEGYNNADRGDSQEAAPTEGEAGQD